MASSTDPITPGDQLVKLIAQVRHAPSYNLFVPREVRQALDGLAEYVAYTEGRLEALQVLCAQVRITCDQVRAGQKLEASLRIPPL